MRNFRAEDMPKAKTSTSAGTKVKADPKDKHTDEINEAADSETAAQKTAPQVPAKKATTKKSTSKKSDS